MYKRILIAVDGSATSDLALREAINLAKDADGQLLIVHAVDEAALMGSDYANPADIWKAVVERGRHILGKAAVRMDTNLIEIDILGRRIPEVIAEEADTWPADFIVVGTHGRRGLSRVFMGSVAEGIARAGTRPVLLIRSE